MRDKIGLPLAALALVALYACGGQETEAEREARERQARADSVRMAEAQYDASVFDTLTWESQEARLNRGGVVWRSSCQKCHGPNGDGRGELARQLELVIPSFLEPDWAYAGDVGAIRHRVYVGYEGAMPNWGLHGLRYRDIDAVAGYVIEAMAPGAEPSGG